MSLIGDWIRVFKGPDTYSTLRNVKNAGIESANIGLLADQGTARQATNKSLADFTSQYLAAQPQREAQTAQETGAIDRYYTGDFDRMLGAIRSNRASALREAGNRAIGYADRARTSASMLRQGDSSYFDRQAMQQTGDIEARIALDQADQEKADFLGAENARITLAGRRGQLGDATTGRLLYPAAASRAANAELTNNLGKLTTIDQANTFYGLQKDQSDMDRAGQIADLADQTIMKLAQSYFGGAAGGSGSGGILSMLGGGNSGGDTSEGSPMWTNPSTGGMGDAGNETGPAATKTSGGWNPYNWNTNNWLGAAKGLYGRAEGGPVMPGTPYVMGENGPEMVVPATPGAGSGTMAGANTMAPANTMASSRAIAIGGMGSVFDDPYMRMVNSVYPNATQIPNKGVPFKTFEQQIRDVLDQGTANGGRVVPIAHSYGASVLRNILEENLGGRRVGVDPIYLDPPVNTPWPRNPLISSLSPLLKNINQASDSGIGNDPNTLTWTGGDTVMWGLNAKHGPWNNEAYPGNAQRVDQAKDILAKKLGQPPPVDAVSAPSVPINDPTAKPIPGRAYGGDVSEGQPYMVGEHGPEVVIPDQSGFVIPNEQTLANNPAAKANIIRQLLSQIRASQMAGDVGPRPTATPVGDSFGAVQAAVDRGTAILSQQADQRVERANHLEQQANKDRQDAAIMKQRLAEWQENVRQAKESATTQKQQFGANLEMQRQHNEAILSRETQTDWRRQAQDVDRSSELARRQSDQANSGEFNEAWQAIGQGLIRDPKDLAHFRTLTPDQSARLTGYIQAGHTADNEQDQAVMSMVAPMASEIRTKRTEQAKKELKEEEAKWTFGTNKQNTEKIAQLKQAIATGAGLPLLPEATWRTYLERLAKNPKLSQLVRIDDATQTITPITKGTAPSSPATASPPPAEAAPGYDFGRMADPTNIGAMPQTAAPTGSLLERAGIPSINTAPARRYRYDPVSGDLVPTQ